MADTTNFGLSKIGQIAVNAHDLDRAVDFYRDLLGKISSHTGGYQVLYGSNRTVTNSDVLHRCPFNQ